MKSSLIIGLFFLIILANLSSASYNLSDYEIEESYAGGDALKGCIEISFKDQREANFTSNFGSTTSLKEILETKFFEDDEYTCIPNNCEKGLKAENPSSSKTISLDSEKKLSFLVEDTDVILKNLRFKLKSNIGNSCFNQVYIDILDDGKNDFWNNEYVQETCSEKNYGCFESDKSSSSALLGGSARYCEKIHLPSAPAYKIGARLENNTQSGKITFEIYDFSGDEDILKKCEVNALSQSIQDVSCIANYSSRKEFDAFVCVTSSTGNYKIRKESNTPCGTSGVPDSDSSLTQDYEIFAQTMKYGSLDKYFNDTIYSTLNNGESLKSVLQDYIDFNYDSDCEDGCPIPLKIYGFNQTIDINDILLEYSYSENTGNSESTKVYDLSESEAKINSETLTIDLEDLNIIVPNFTGNKSFELKFDGKTLFSKNINIETGFNFDVNPKNVLIAQRVRFLLNINDTLSKVTWDFGDGEKTETNTKEVYHSYKSSGKYTLSIELTKSNNQKSLKRFTINVGDAKQSLERIIAQSEIKIRNLTSDLNSFDSWIKEEIEKEIDINALNELIKKSKASINNSSDEDIYLEMLNNSLIIDIPYGIDYSLQGKSLIEEGAEYFDYSLLEELSKKEVEDEDKLRDSILSWIDENYELDMNFGIISLFKDYNKEELMSVFKINVKKTSESKEADYLFIGYPLENIIFKQDYGQKSLGQGVGTYIPIKDTNSNFEFIIKEGITFDSLGVYISPEITKLSLSPDEIKDADFSTKEYPIGKVLLWIFILIIFTLVVYISLQEWYKRHYEKYLFPNKDDLYNVINFIYNARASSLKDEEIRSKLLRLRWTGEQVTFAFRKIDGKRTGMYEIPIFKVFENMKVKEEIAKRQEGGILDARFIKRGNI